MWNLLLLLAIHRLDGVRPMCTAIVIEKVARELIFRAYASIEGHGVSWMSLLLLLTSKLWEIRSGRSLMKSSLLLRYLLNLMLQPTEGGIGISLLQLLLLLSSCLGQQLFHFEFDLLMCLTKGIQTIDGILLLHALVVTVHLLMIQQSAHVEICVLRHVTCLDHGGRRSHGGCLYRRSRVVVGLSNTLGFLRASTNRLALLLTLLPCFEDLAVFFLFHQGMSLQERLGSTVQLLPSPSDGTGKLLETDLTVSLAVSSLALNFVLCNDPTDFLIGQREV